MEIFEKESSMEYISCSCYNFTVISINFNINLTPKMAQEHNPEVVVQLKIIKFLSAF